jgi:hypothetical protein
MSILEGLVLNWVQYQFSHGTEMTTIRILLFGWLLHSRLESLEVVKFNSRLDVQKKILGFSHLSSSTIRPSARSSPSSTRRSSLSSCHCPWREGPLPS